jgi:PEGA domain-containing protein
MTRITLTLALLVALTSPARAGGDVGVIVTGEASMQPQLAAQIESWLSQHGHTLVPSPLPPEAITALIDCFVMENQGCARDVIEKRAKSTGMVYAHVDTKTGATGARDVTVTAYWFDKGHDAISERKNCERCTDQSMRTTADEILKKLLGGSDLGHIKLSSNPSGARISIDGQAIGVTPLDWDLPAGKHTILMDKAGLKPVTRDIVVVSNKPDAVGMVLLPVGQAPDDHGEDQPSRIIPISLLGAGGALVITGIVLIAIDEDPGPHEPARIYNTFGLGVGVAVVGALAAAGGTYLWLRSSKASSTPVAAFTSDTAYVGWLGRF